MKLTTARAADRSVLMLGTIGLAGKAYGVPSPEFWVVVTRQYPAAIILLLLMVGVFGALTPVEALTARARADSAISVRRRVLTRFGQILDIARNVDPPLDVNDLALHIWRINRTVRHPVRGVLTRVVTYRLGASPRNKPFTPPLGVGVVGMCWKKNQVHEVDVAALAAKWDTKEKYQAYARKHGDELMNLTWEEFEKVKHRGAVFATPVNDSRGKFIGCVSVDTSRGFAALSGSRLQEEMGQVSDIVADVGLASF